MKSLPRVIDADRAAGVSVRCTSRQRSTIILHRLVPGGFAEFARLSRANDGRISRSGLSFAAQACKPLGPRRPRLILIVAAPATSPRSGSPSTPNQSRSRWCRGRSTTGPSGRALLPFLVHANGPLILADVRRPMLELFDAIASCGHRQGPETAGVKRRKAGIGGNRICRLPQN